MSQNSSETCTCTHEAILLYPSSTEAVLEVFQATIGTLDSIVAALEQANYVEAQAKALGDTAEAAVLLASEAIKAILETDEAYVEGFEDGYEEGCEDGYEEGREDGYDEAACDLTDDDEIEVPTQLFHCTECDSIDDLVVLSSETGDKLCPVCGTAMEPYVLDEDPEDADDPETPGGTGEKDDEEASDE